MPQDSIDALIFVSLTPDYELRATACSPHARLGLKLDTIAFDVNLGCSGYSYAVWLAMTMIAGRAADRVLLAVRDTISRLVDPLDRGNAMLFGDAGTMTALEFSSNDDALDAANFVLGTDGSGVPRLISRGAAYRASPVGVDEHHAARGYLYMDGGDIFNFTLRTIPALVTETLEAAAMSADRYGAYLFHQTNLFMVNHLAKKTKLPAERIPINSPLKTLELIEL